MDNGISQFISQTNPAVFWPTVAFIIAALGGLGYLLYRINRPSDEKQIDQTIKELSDEYMENAIISDGMYGYFFIDYLVYLSGQILLIGIEHYEGYIFGSENIDEWAQVVDKKSYKFNNPLRSYVACAQMVNSMIEGANARAHIVFTGASSFPKGIPAGVFQMSDFRSGLEDIKSSNAASETNVRHWAALKKAANEHASQYHQEKMQAN